MGSIPITRSTATLIVSARRLGHSTVAGSVMEASYGSVRRALTSDDVLGIQALYGVNPVPEPSTYLMLMAGMLGVLGYRRKRLTKSGN